MVMEITKDQEKNLIKLLNEKAISADINHGLLAKEVNTGLEYYFGNLPSVQSLGSSKYVDRTVFEAVESLLPQLVATFASDGAQAVRLKIGDHELNNAMNNYINDTVMRKQDGFNIITTYIKEALMQKVGILKVDWKNSRNLHKVAIKNATATQVSDIIKIMPIEVDDKKSKLKENDGIYNGEIVFNEDTSMPVIENVDFSNFRAAPETQNIKDCNYSSYLYPSTIAELEGEGYNRSILDENKGNGTSGWILSTEANTLHKYRFNKVSDNIYLEAVNVVKTDEIVIVEEAYVKTSMFYKNEMALYQVIRLGDAVLEINEVDRNPFVVTSPILIPGNLYGMSIPDITKDLQNAKTWAMRAVFDNAAASTWNRWVGVKGDYDKKGLVNATHNSVIEVAEQGALTPLITPTLGNSVLTILQTIENDKAERIGVSAAAKGLNKDVFSGNNSAQLVDQMVSQSEARIRLIARTLAHNGISKIISQVYDCYRENYKKPFPVGDKQITMQQLPKSVKIDIDVNLGAGEKSQSAKELLVLISNMSSDPSLSQIFSPSNKYAMYKDVIEKLGYEDSVNNYLTDPNTIEPIAPSPQETMIDHFNLESMQLDNEYKAQAIQFGELDAQIRASDHTHKLEKDEAYQELKADEQNRLDIESSSKQLVSAEELALSKTIQEHKEELSANKMILEEDMAKWKIIKETAEINLETTNSKARQLVSAEELALSKTIQEHKEELSADKMTLEEELAKWKIIKDTAEVNLETVQDRPVSFD
jgi:hypothetical protein